MSEHVERDGVGQIHRVGLGSGLWRGRGKQGKEGGLPRATPPVYLPLGIRWPSHLVAMYPHHREGQWRAGRHFVVVISLSCAHIPQ